MAVPRPRVSLQEYIRSRGYNARSGHSDEKTSNASKNEFHSGRRPLSTVVWLGTREDGTSRIVALLQLDRVRVLAPSCRDPTLMSLVAVRWGTQGQPNLSDLSLRSQTYFRCWSRTTWGAVKWTDGVAVKWTDRVWFLRSKRGQCDRPALPHCASPLPEPARPQNLAHMGPRVPELPCSAPSCIAKRWEGIDAMNCPQVIRSYALCVVLENLQVTFRRALRLRTVDRWAWKATWRLMVASIQDRLLRHRTVRIVTPAMARERARLLDQRNRGHLSPSHASCPY